MTACSHLDQIEFLELPEPVEGCAECLASDGTLGAPAHVPELRADRLLRQLAEPPRVSTRGYDRARDRPVGRAGGGMELVLRR